MRRTGTGDRFPLWLYWTTPLLSIALSLLVIEVLLRLVYPVPFSIERNMYFEPDPHTGYRLKPGSVGRFQNGIPAVVNAHGHRDDMVRRLAAAGTLRLLFLGDSFTVGANVLQEEAFPQVLERLMTGDPERPVQVINAGVGGWEPFQYAQYFEHYGREFEPDLILIGFFVGNDSYDSSARIEDLRTAVLGRRVTRNAGTGGLTRLLVFLTERSHLTRLVLRRGPVAQDFRRDTCDRFTDQYLAIQAARLPAHLRREERHELAARNAVTQITRIKSLAEQDGSSLIVVLIPDENQLNAALQDALIPAGSRSAYDFGMPQTLLVELFDEAGIETIDLLPAFRADPRCLYMNDTHWTPEGHELAASVIWKEVTARLPGF